MSKEKTLDEALDEMDKWSDAMVRDIGGLSPAEFRKYFREAQSRLEEATGVKLNLPKARRKPAKT
jgi:hypothetical protein